MHAFKLSDIRHGIHGFQSLIDMHEGAKDLLREDINIDMSQTKWFDADMCAVLGALLCCIEHNSNNVSFSNILPKIKSIFSKNGFLSHYDHDLMTDKFMTTIPYKKFNLEDENYFYSYVEKEFMGRSEMPQMSTKLLKKFRNSIFEIFSNTVLHSRTKLGVFSCGQFYPRKKELDFTVVDLGMGIRENIKKYAGLDLTAEQAIDWATSDNNTTRQDGAPGGLGLKLLCKFLDLNGGRIQIVSDSGYWKRKDKKTEKNALSCAFPGTAVHVGINTSDKNSYMLSSELTGENIF